jgi:hypothetical protein
MYSKNAIKETTYMSICCKLHFLIIHAPPFGP